MKHYLKHYIFVVITKLDIFSFNLKTAFFHLRKMSLMNQHFLWRHTTGLDNTFYELFRGIYIF